MKYKNSLLFQLLLAASIEASFFSKEGETVFEYLATVQTLIEVPSTVVSNYEIHTTIHVRQHEDKSVFTLYKPRVKETMGDLESVTKDTTTPNTYEGDFLELPFVVHYFENGTINFFEMDAKDSTWSINLKKGIASLFQLDRINIQKHYNENHIFSFNSHEHTLSGECETVYNIDPQDEEELKIHKTFENCDENWLERLTQRENVKSTKDLVKTSKYRSYEINYKNSEILIEGIESNWKLIFFPIDTESGSHSVNINQMIMKTKRSVDLVEDKSTEKTIHSLCDTKDMDMTSYVVHGGTEDKSNCNVNHVQETLQEIVTYFKTSQIRLQEPNWNQTNSFYNLIFTLRGVDIECFNSLFNHLNNTSTVSSEIRELFTSVLPFIGTYSSTAFIHSLVKNHLVDDSIAETFYKEMPFHVMFPNKKLIEELSDILKWNKNNNMDKTVLKSAVLAFSTILSKIEISEADPYVDQLIDLYNSSNDYEWKILYISALKNTHSNKIVKLLEPIVVNKPKDSAVTPNLRNIAMWAVMSQHTKNTIESQKIYLPILLSNSEDFELRVNALKILMNDLSMENLMKIEHLMKEEIQNENLYSVFYSTLYSLSTSYSPSLAESRQKALDFLQHVPAIAQISYEAHSNTYDFYDEKHNTGMIVKVSVVGSFYNRGEVSVYIHLTSYLSNIMEDQHSFYLKIQVNDKVKETLVKVLNTIDSMNLMKVQNLITEILKLKEEDFKESHIEMIAQEANQIKNIKIYDTIKAIEEDFLKFLRVKNTLLYSISNFAESVVAVPSDIGVPVVSYISIPTLNRLNIENKEFEFDLKIDFQGWNLQTYGIQILNPLTNNWLGSRRYFQTDFRLPIAIQPILESDNFEVKLNLKNDDYFNKGDIGLQTFTQSQVYMYTQDTQTEKQFYPFKAGTKSKNLNWNFDLEETGMMYKISTFDCGYDFPKLYFINLKADLISTSDINSGDSDIIMNLLRMKKIWSRFTFASDSDTCGFGIKGTRYNHDATDVTVKISKELLDVALIEQNEIKLPSGIASLKFSYKLQNKDFVVIGWDAQFDLEVLGEWIPKTNYTITLTRHNKEEMKTFITDESSGNTRKVNANIRINDTEPTTIEVEMKNSKSKEQQTKKNIYYECANEKSKNTYACLVARTALLHEDYKINYKNVQPLNAYLETFNNYIRLAYNSFYQTFPGRKQLDEGSLAVHIDYKVATKDINVFIDGPFTSYGYTGISNDDDDLLSGFLDPQSRPLESDVLFNYEVGKNFVCEIRSKYFINQYHRRTVNRLTDKLVLFVSYDIPTAKIYAKKSDDGLFLQYEIGESVMTVHGEMNALNVTYNGETISLDSLDPTKHPEVESGSVGYFEYRMLFDNDAFLISAPLITDTVVSYTDGVIYIYADRDNDAIGLCFHRKE